MKFKINVLGFLVLLMCTACINEIGLIQSSTNNTDISGEEGVQNPTIVARAERSLTDYFTALNQGEYAKAATLFGGSYETLQDYNPSLDPEDHAALFQAGCEFNGLMCLPIREIISVENNNAHEVSFNVEFANPDGTSFVRGPCCGESAESMPPISTFMIRVRCQEESTCQVLDLPPYVP